MQEQNSVLTCTNLCQSFQSSSIDTVKQKQINSLIQNQMELEQTNNELKIIIQRYNQDLVEYFKENQNLIQLNKDLMMHNEALQIELFKKISLDKSTQTDFATRKKDAETQMEQRESIQKSLNQSCSNQKSQKTDNQNEKRKIQRECQRYSPSMSFRDEQTSPKNVDYEYFENKKHLEKMLQKLTQKIQFLSDTINETESQNFQKQSILLCLQEIQSIASYLKILINDQIAEIKKFADQVNCQVQEIIEEANRIQKISSQSKDESFKLISFTEFTQNTNTSYQFSNEEFNQNKSSEFLIDPNCTIINTSRNTDNALQDSDIYNFQDELLNQNKGFQNNLNQINFQEKNLNDNFECNNHFSEFRQNSKNRNEKKKEDNQCNQKQNIKNLVSDQNEQENHQSRQDKQEIKVIENDNKLKLNLSSFNSQNKLNQTGSFLEDKDDQLNDSNDQISQYENLLETLGDEEFDLEEISNKQNTLHKQHKKKPENKSKAQLLNKILTFSFGNNPVCLNNNQFQIPKQAIKDQQENEDHIKLIKQEELNVQIQNKLQNIQKCYLEFVNKLLSLIGDERTQITIDKYFQSDVLQQEVLEKSTLESQSKILSVFERLAQFKQDIDAVHRSTLSQSQFTGECITESTLEQIGQSFYADQIQKQFITKVKMNFNQRIENIRRVKFNMESMKKILTDKNSEICKQYDLYGITTADIIYLKQYIQELQHFMNQMNQKSIESIKSQFIERCLSDINQLKISSELKILSEFIKSSIILMITIKSYF